MVDAADNRGGWMAVEEKGKGAAVEGEGRGLVGIGRVGRAVRLGGQAGVVHGDLDFWSG